MNVMQAGQWQLGRFRPALGRQAELVGLILPRRAGDHRHDHRAHGHEASYLIPGHRPPIIDAPARLPARKLVLRPDHPIPPHQRAGDEHDRGDQSDQGPQELGWPAREPAEVEVGEPVQHGVAHT